MERVSLGMYTSGEEAPTQRNATDVYTYTDFRYPRCVAFFEWDAVCAFLVSSLNIFLLPRQTGIYGSDDATRCTPRLRFHLYIYIYAVVKKRSFRTPLKSLQFKARRADFRFFYVASVKST